MKKLKFDSKMISINQKKILIKNNDVINSKIQAISFFSGAGGLDIGVQLSGVKVIASLDNDRDSINTLMQNKYFKHTKHILNKIQDVDMMDYSDIIKYNKPEKLILVGGPPCQPFSKAGYWKTHKKRLGNNDPRNMIGQYLEKILEIKPDGFILENVESILHPKNIIAAEYIIEQSKIIGYNLKIIKVNSADYGVPQKRKRVFFLGSKNKFENELKPTHGTEKEIEINKTLKPYERVIDWIDKYDNIKYSDNYDSIEGKYYNELVSVPPGKNYLSLTEKRGCKEPKFIAGKRYWSFLLKLHPLLPSWTIISSPGHWEGPFHWNNRRLRLKELAAIQTFPEDYSFSGSRRSVQKQIGNAVPPLLAQHITDYLIKNL